MPRLLKPLLVETFHSDEYGVDIPIEYNRNFHFHEAEVAGTHFHHADIAEVRKWIAGQIAHTQAVVWRAVIEVGLPGSAHHGGDAEVTVGLTIERYHVARLPDDTYRRAHWNSDPDKRLGSSPRSFDWPPGKRFEPPCERHSGYGRRRGPFYYPYDEALWLELGRMVERLRTLKDGLTALLDTRGGAWRAIGTPMAPSLAGLLERPAEEPTLPAIVVERVLS